MGVPHSPQPVAELKQAGGAYVRRRFMFGDREMLAGDTMTADDLRSIPTNNLVALVNTGRLQLWPAAPEGMFLAERFAVNLGFGKWAVIEGRKLTDEPVTKEEAEAMVAASQTRN